jgi:glutathione S-transferase
MPHPRLHCFAQSGNCFKVAMFLNCAGMTWQPMFVDFFAGTTRDPAWRTGQNAMGEAPVLEIAGKRLSQSGAILTYLADTKGRFQPVSEDERLDVLRWILFDNHKFTGNFATYRFLRSLAPQPPDPAVLAFLKGRAEAAFRIVDLHLTDRDFLVGEALSIADLSLSGYLFYPEDEHGFDIANAYPNIDRWRSRIANMPGWVEPYSCMPGERFLARR